MFILSIVEGILLGLFAVLLKRRDGAGREWRIWAGLVCAAIGDFCLIVLQGRPHGVFLAGVAAFACAHLCWIAAAVREARPDGRILLALVPPLAGFLAARLFPSPSLDAVTAAALGGYTLLSAVSLAAAMGTRRGFFSGAIACLLFSDLMIGCRMARIPHYGALVGPFYLTALVLMVCSLFARNERRLRFGRGDPLPVVLIGGLAAAVCFGVAMAVCPVPYNPCMKMLSHLGRTRIADVAYPACHYLFSLGLFIGALSSAYFAPHFAARAETPLRRRIIPWGGALNFAGLCLIIAAPENVSCLCHNMGCHFAVLGGVTILFALATNPAARRAAALLAILPATLGVLLGLHACRIIRFAPWIPTCQKLLILSFPIWIICRAASRSSRARP